MRVWPCRSNSGLLDTGSVNLANGFSVEIRIIRKLILELYNPGWLRIALNLCFQSSCFRSHELGSQVCAATPSSCGRCVPEVLRMEPNSLSQPIPRQRLCHSARYWVHKELTKGSSRDALGIAWRLAHTKASGH